MEHENVERTRAAYAAFARGDMAVVTDLMSDDVVWHVTGNGPLAGDYKGQDEILGYFGKLFEATGGSLAIDVDDILANDRHATAIVHMSAMREGMILDENAVHVFELEDGKVKAFWSFDSDPEQLERFWQ